jgi:DNA repair protein RadC
VYNSAREVFDYLYHSMLDLKKEVLKVIYLNVRNQILEVEDIFEGTVSASSVYPCEVMNTAIKYNAAALILPITIPPAAPSLALAMGHLPETWSKPGASCRLRPWTTS